MTVMALICDALEMKMYVYRGILITSEKVNMVHGGKTHHGPPHFNCGSI